MSEPRWTVDQHGALMYRLPKGGWGNPAVIFSRATPEDLALAAHEELVALVRGASEIESLRARLEAAEAVITEAERFLDRTEGCRDPVATCTETYGRPLREAIARARGEQV